MRQFDLLSQQHFEKFKSAFNLDKWTSENINDGGVLGKVLKMPGINLLVKYIGGALTYSCFHVEDDHIASVSHLEGGSAEV